MKIKHRAANCFDIIRVGELFYFSAGLAELTRGELVNNGIPYRTEIVWDRVYVMSIGEITELMEMFVKLTHDLDDDKQAETPVVESDASE